MYALHKELLGWKMSQSLVKLSGEGGGMTLFLCFKLMLEESFSFEKSKNLTFSA